MSETVRPDIAIREASVADAARLSLVADATFLETFAGLIDGEALVAHCARHHAIDHLREQLVGGARAWLAELGGAPVGYAMLTAPELDAAGPEDGELKKIYLLSRFHGGDTAARLLASVIAAAKGYSRSLSAARSSSIFRRAASC